MRQVKSEEVDLALNPTDDADSFAKVDLGMTRRMMRRLSRRLVSLPRCHARMRASSFAISVASASS